MKPLRTVLIVDDDPATVDLLSTSVPRLEFRVLSAQTPTEALTIAERATLALDVVITDILMPEMSGVELGRKIHERWPRVKMVYMSADAKAQALVAKVDQSAPFLRKPFTLEDLEKTVRQVLTEAASAKAALTCSRCGSKNIRPSQRRIYDWILLPFLVPYRCRSCRARFFRVRVIGRLIAGGRR